MTEIVVQTARLVLRTEAQGDAAVWLAHMNTPQVMACLGGPRSPEDVAQSFAKMREPGAIRNGQPLRFLLVALREDDTLIGKSGLATIDTEAAPAELRGQVQIGWTLRADYWGHGYATEAAQAALALAFEQHAVAAVFSQTSERNVASWRVMERLGMTRRADLDYVDPDYPPEDNPTMVYALDRADWSAGKQVAS